MGTGNAKLNTPPSHRCDKHRGRFAAVTVNGVGKCWQCYLDARTFTRRFGAGYYETENGKNGDCKV